MRGNRNNDSVDTEATFGVSSHLQSKRNTNLCTPAQLEPPRPVSLIDSLRLFEVFIVEKEAGVT